MIKFHFLLCAVLALCASLTAIAAPMKSIVITRTDGSVSTIAMESDMEASVADGDLKLSCSKGDIFVPLNELGKWTYSSDSGNGDIWAGVGTTPADMLVIAIECGRITLDNLPSRTRVRLMAIDGKTAFDSVASDFCEIITSGLPHGVYLLSAGDKTYKIALR